MNKDLIALLKKAKHVKLTREESREQAISFAYGNLKLHNPAITREEVEKAAELLEKVEEPNDKKP